MPNERSTEEIVRDYFKTNSCAGQIWEEQTSDDARIKKALSQASKSGTGSGKPEFLIRLENDPDFIIVVECKSDKSKHESADRNRPIDYAVDGVLVYMAHLARHFDVIGIAVSGTDPASVAVSVFRQLRRSTAHELLRDEHGPIEKLLPIPELRRLLTFDPDVRRRSQDDLMAFSQRLHIYLRDYAKLSENEKPLAVSGCLLALRDDAFKSNWRKYKSNSLGREMISALRREIEAAVPEINKQRVMLGPYQFLESHPELNRTPKGKSEWPLRSLVGLIEDNVRPFLDTYKDIDVIGQF